MKMSLNLLKATALAACVFLPAAATADSPSFKTGRYALGPTSNLNSFTCASTGEEACKALFQMKSKLTKEELNHLSDSGERAYLGDFVVTRENGEADLYSVKGGVFVGRAGEYRFHSKDSDKAPCQLAKPNVLVCSVYDEDEETETRATLTFQKKDKVDLQVEIAGDSAGASPVIEELIRFVDGQTFTFETEEEYRHDMYISAKLNYLMVDASLNKKWKSLDKKVRDQLLPEQRSWIAEKDQECGAVTMKGSESELTEMYTCQSKMTADRLYEELSNY
ncbi:lysozyme inhibitor LprI family protein [Succinimonas amylolytica]|uniref:lysozyme inhibitor LprI family protein n=1 Tax=Succinimonas amylolytica TaxID=83769 RepID=UPI0023A89C4F